MNFSKIGESNMLEGFCIIKQIEIKTTAKGSQYLDMTIADNEGEINAKLWDYRDIPSNRFELYDFIKVRGTMVPFNDTMQFRVDRIRKVTPEDGVLLDDYVPTACLPGEVMLSEIRKIVDEFEDEELKRLVLCILNRHEEQLLYWPAAKNLHHAVRGGLLMHTLSILRLCKAVCKIYGYINYDLLCSGAILHDIAKLEEINASEAGISSEYTVRGNLLGHLVMGAMEIDQIGKELEIDEDKLTLVEHMLVSHHGVPEYGAAKLPAFIEAIVLSELDNLDAKLFTASNAVFDVKAGEFTPKQWSLDNRLLYNHGLEGSGNINLED